MSPEGKSSPQLLSDVVHAVANLNEIHGSTARTIADRVQKALLRSSCSSNRPLTLQDIRQALIDGVEVGFLTKHARRYKIDVNKPVVTDDGESDDVESENGNDDKQVFTEAAAPAVPKPPQKTKRVRKYKKRVRSTRRKIAKTKSKRRVQSQKRSRSRRQRGRPRQPSVTSTEVSREDTPKPTPVEPKPEAPPISEPKPTEEEGPSTSGRRRRKRNTRVPSRNREVQDIEINECTEDAEIPPTSCDNEDCVCHLEEQRQNDAMETEDDVETPLDYIN